MEDEVLVEIHFDSWVAAILDNQRGIRDFSDGDSGRAGIFVYV